MDLSLEQGREALASSVKSGKQRYSYYNGKIYKFQPDNAGGWHGYPVSGKEVPTEVLRDYKTKGIISISEYRRIIKDK